jgi:hypothetical protein
LKKYKSPGSDQIPAELFQTGSETLQFQIQEPINSTWNKEELPTHLMESIIVPTQRRAIKLTVVITMGYHCYQFHAKLYPISSSPG